MKKKYKLIVVDDHHLFRAGIIALLSDLDYIEVVAEAKDGIDFLDFLKYNEVDIALMDIRMPRMDGVEATQTAMEKYPDLKIIALSMFGEEQYYYSMIDAGVKGFILKEQSSAEELEQALKLVISGQTFFSQALLHNIILKISHDKKAKENVKVDDAKLSGRELQILEHICSGASNSEIADELCISIRTVERHRSNLLTKTGAKNSVNLVMYAIKNKLIDI